MTATKETATKETGTVDEVVCQRCGNHVTLEIHRNVYGWVTGRTCPRCHAAWHRCDSDRRKENLYRYYWSLIVSAS